MKHLSFRRTKILFIKQQVFVTRQIEHRQLRPAGRASRLLGTGSRGASFFL